MGSDPVHGRPGRRATLVLGGLALAMLALSVAKPDCQGYLAAPRPVGATAPTCYPSGLALAGALLAGSGAIVAAPSRSRADWRRAIRLVAIALVAAAAVALGAALLVHDCVRISHDQVSCGTPDWLRGSAFTLIAAGPAAAALVGLLRMAAWVRSHPKAA